MIKLIAEGGNPDSQAAILGVGIDHVPKGSGPVTLRAYKRSFPEGPMGIDFRRKASEVQWSNATFSLLADGFPVEIFALRLKPSFFDGLTPIGASLSKHPDEEPSEVHTFAFRTGSPGRTVRVEFDAHTAVTSLSEAYPSTFHRVTVSKVR